MSKDYLSLGSTPACEECAAVGSDNYQSRMRLESRLYIAQLERQFPNLPDGVYFRNKGFSHEFGTYHEVCVFFDDSDDTQIEAAYDVENNLPEKWDMPAQLAIDLASGKETTYDSSNRLVKS